MIVTISITVLASHDSSRSTILVVENIHEPVIVVVYVAVTTLEVVVSIIDV